jgi:hypothetical protein
MILNPGRKRALIAKKVFLFYACGVDAILAFYFGSIMMLSWFLFYVLCSRKVKRKGFDSHLNRQLSLMVLMLRCRLQPRHPGLLCHMLE